MFELGEIVKDKITGFTGTIVARTEHLGGLKQHLVQAKWKGDEKAPESMWFEEHRLQENASASKKDSGKKKLASKK